MEVKEVKEVNFQKLSHHHSYMKRGAVSQQPLFQILKN